jgi:hypothetical protein
MPCLCRQFIILYNLMFVTVLLLKFHGGPFLLLDPFWLRVLRGVSLRDLNPATLQHPDELTSSVSRILSSLTHAAPYISHATLFITAPQIEFHGYVTPV